MASLRIQVPDGTINYIKNPALRYDTTGWTAAASSITRSLDYARIGIASLKVVTNGAALGEGCYYRVNWLNGISDPITGSIYIRGSGIVRVRLVESKTWISDNIELSPSRWQRVEVSGYSVGSNDVRIYVETVGRIQAATFYVDGAQIERHPYATTYCDGDQEGCWWNIIHHNSISTRPATTRAGGRWVSLGGCDREESNLYFTVIGGLGVAPIRNDLQSFADAPGSYYQSTKVLDRVVTFTFYVKAPKLKSLLSTSLRDLHKLRQMLWDIVKPDLTRGGEEFLIEYQDGAFPLYFRARYDGGLEGEWDVRNQWVNSFPLRLIVVSPFLQEDNQEVTQIAFRNSQTVNNIMQRFDGNWSEMNGGVDNTVFALALGSKGEVIAGGQFVKANNKLTAIHPMISANRICYWDGTEWQQLGTGANNIVRAVAMAPNGDIYAGGDFTSIGGVAANGIARWVSATSTWQALGTGVSGGGASVYAIKVAPNGDVYAGGTFQAAGGNPAYYIARWDGGSWHNIGGLGGLGNLVRAIVISDDGTQVFVGGAFNGEIFGPTGTLNYVAVYYPEINTFLPLDNGFDSVVYALAYSENGRILYAGGDFNAAGPLITGVSMPRVAYFNGAQWLDMNGGADERVFGLSVSPSGELLAVGQFTSIGGIDARYAAVWSGNTWKALDTDISAITYACMYDRNGNIYIGCAAAVDFSSTTVVNNPGSAEASPVLYIQGQGTLKWIENQTSRKRLYADLDVLAGEEVFIDFARGTALSSIRGSLTFAVLPGSDFHAWKLLPGDNEIVALMENNLASKMQLSLVPRHWSVDATQRVDAF